MYTVPDNKSKSVVPPALLSFVLLAAFSTLPGCQRTEETNSKSGEQSAVAADSQSAIAQPDGADLPLGDVAEFDGFTLRANLSPTEFLSDAMAQRYGIEAGPDLALLNLVVMQKRADQQPAAVSAEVSAQFETLIGHVEVIDMRKAEADGHVSYIGTLDTSSQRVFRFTIEAQPAEADEPLRMNFEVQLPTANTD